MFFRLYSAALILFILFSLSQQGRGQMLTLGVGNGGAATAPAAYTGLGDLGLSGIIAYWGLQCYSTSYTGNVALIVDQATGLTTTTITCSAGGILNKPGIASTCASTCVVKTLYDQSGLTKCTSAACTVTQTTLANMPVYIQNCLGSNDCARFTLASSMNLNNAAFNSTPASLPNTILWVAKNIDVSSTYQSILGVSSGSEAYGTVTTNTFQFTGGNTAGSAISNNAWHSVQLLIAAGAGASVSEVDGTATAITNSSPAVFLDGNFSVGDSARPWNGDVGELAIYDSGLSSSSYGAICHNQFVRWGTPTSC